MRSSSSIARGGARDALVVGARQQRRHLLTLAVDGRGERPAAPRAHGPQVQHQHPRAPVAGLGGVRVRAGHDHAGTLGEVGAELLRRARRCRRRSASSRRSTTLMKSCAASSLAHSGARARSTSSPSRVVTIRSADRGSLGAAAGAPAQLADHRVGDPQLDRLHAGARGEQLLLLGVRAGGDGEDGAGAIDQGDAGVERLGRRPGDRGQPGSRLDRLRERLEARGLAASSGCRIGAFRAGRAPRNGKRSQPLRARRQTIWLMSSQ